MPKLCSVQLKRGHLQTFLWKNALKLEPQKINPSEYRWRKMEMSSAQLQFLQKINLSQITYKISPVLAAPVNHFVKMSDVDATKQE